MLDRKNYITLRNTGKDCPVDTETFIAYYTQSYESDLRRFFEITNNFGDKSYPFVLEMTCEMTNLGRKDMIWEDMNHYYMFSAAVFYMSMCTQIVGRLYGWHQMENFMRASQWPMLSCGMGGLRHPIDVMWKSELNPVSSDDSYTETLLNAGKYLKVEFLEFMKKGEPCLDRSAHDALVDTVDINELSEVFDKQEQLYCEWIKNPDTKYEDLYVAHPMDHLEMVSVQEYLKEYREEMPQWLAEYKSGDQVSFSEFMNCRLGYYPGSGFDGNLVKVGNQSHAIHCFLHADYGIARETLDQHLESGGCFAGYHSIGRVDWSDTVSIDSSHKSLIQEEPYCFMEIFERDLDKDDSWGAKRFAVTFLFADGIQTYKQLFVNQYKKAPWLFLLQDHGFGGNYDKFGKGGALDRIISKGEKPEFVICGVNTAVWAGYFRIERVHPTCNTLGISSRRLYTNNYENL